MGQQAGSNGRDAIQTTTIRGPRTEYRRNSPVEFGRENASACVAACFDKLIPNVEDACKELQQSQYQQARLWDLYCCDSINCGVYIGNIGQSPNVDLIINECQNIGFFSIEDPGPPAANYCASPTPGATALFTLLPTHTSETPIPLASTSILASSSTSTSSPSSSNNNSTQLTAGVKVAIGVFSILALLAITALLLLLFRWRRRSPRASSPGPLLVSYDNPSYPGSHSTSRTPLITPLPSASSRTTPLIPPAKLSDRRYLQLVPKAGDSSGESNRDSPLSPTRSPRPIHQHGRRATSNIQLPVKASESPKYPHRSVYSSSGLGASTVTMETNKASSALSSSATVTETSTPPPTPKRFPQTHDGPLELSDFVTPAGPPPSRALPALPTSPPNHPNSPAISAPPLSPKSPTFPAQSVVRGDSPIVPTRQGSTPLPPTTISTEELCELTESYAQETRGSWGSWSGVGGGGPGVVPLNRKRGSTERNGEKKTALAAQDLDLEKLSGRY
ncbi:hypothetical protein O1611_g3365 [Lasiodiplodia mahajangana]|uniref:Uncharacterized protein n=1 Tax=Lasiodiplodia mahajangana TaxID=1108764 RepID=A0ACC2JRZ8_9PEZI|nr:hypothetical protein O1611_g3365 [Lasiodiplodia mahajangana]